MITSVIIICLVLLQLQDFNLIVSPASGQIRPFFVPSIWRQSFLIHRAKNNNLLSETNYTYTAEDLLVAELIKKNSRSNQPIYSLTRLPTVKGNLPFHAAQHWGYLADRPYLNRRNPEEYFYPPVDPQQAAILIINKQQTLPQKLKGNFALLAQTDHLVLYRKINESQ